MMKSLERNLVKLVVLVGLMSLVVRGAGIQPCVFEYNSTLISQGEVYSPNYPNAYPNNLNCRYEFYGRENERIIIQIDDFQLEAPQSTSLNDLNLMDYMETATREGSSGKKSYSNKNNKHVNEVSSSNETSDLDSASAALSTSNRQCFYDFLDVFTSDGQGRMYWRSRHCGSHIDSQIVSTSPTLILVFKTDRMLSFRGFKFRFHFSYINILPFVTDPICGSSEIVGNGSILQSPNYPRMFPSELECAWTITVEKHQNILVKFLDVNLFQPCHLSYLHIWDGYVSDVNKPDFVVCEKLMYYHKGMLQYKSKTNRIVIKFVGNKNPDQFKNRLRQNTLAEDPVEDKAKGSKYGFYLTWTGVHLSDSCHPGEFKCKGGEYCIDSKNFLCQTSYKYCIDKSLLCDGVYNCDISDTSDEKHCELNYLKSRLYVSVLAILGIVAVLICFFCIAFYRGQRERNQAIKLITQDDSSQRELTKRRNSKQDFYTDMSASYSMPQPVFMSFTDEKNNGTDRTKRKASLTLQQSGSISNSAAGYYDVDYKGLKKSPSSTGYRERDSGEKEDVTKSPEIKIISNTSNNSIFLSNYKPLHDDTLNEESTQLLIATGMMKQSASAHVNTAATSTANTTTNNDTTQLTGSYNGGTPTCSSSLPSESSLSSPLDSSSLLIQQHRTPTNNYYEKSKKGSGNKYTVVETTKRVNERNDKHLLLIEDPAALALRRNSYTKAIFSENVQSK